MDRLKFPDGFLWGGATASEQADGRGNNEKGKTIWDKHFEAKNEMFFNGVGPETTNDFALRYIDDLKLFSEIGANSIRYGFSWARLFPDGKTLNQEAVNYYHDVIKNSSKNNLTLFMTLFHFDMPLWAQELGGWESNEVINKYVEYAEFVFKEFGNEVDYFVTMNEPIVPVFAGYMYGIHWPLIKDEKRAAQVAFGTILAHARAVNVFNEKYRDNVKVKIGVVINVAPGYPKDGINFSEEDQIAANKFDILHNYSMLDPMIKGIWPKELKNILIEMDVLPKYTEDELSEISKVKIDFLGTNFYGPTRVEAQTDFEEKVGWERYIKHWTWDDARINVFRGWEIYPKAIYDISMIIKDRYDNIPFYISENGMGVQREWEFRDSETGIINDDYRIAFLNEHLYWLWKGIQDGSSCFGYHMWAIFDCWSWANAYKNTYGFIEIDLKDNLKRRPKKSASWLKETSSTNSTPKEFKVLEEVLDIKNAKFEKSV